MEVQKTGVFLFGLPCSGKSTWYEENKHRFRSKENDSNFAISDYNYISADEIKKEFPDYNEESISMYSNEAIAMAEQRVQIAVDTGMNFVMDAGAINNSYTSRILAYAKKQGYKTIMYHIDTPYHVCVERNEKRARKVPRELIAAKAFKKDYHWAKYERSKLVDETYTIPYYTCKHMFFDMDGVLAAQSNLPTVDGKIDFVNSNYFRYLPVVDQVRNIVKFLNNLEDREIYILSAAPTSISMQEKLDWLEDYFPFIKKENIFFVNAGQYKAEMFHDLSTRLKLDKKDMCLVEDTHHIIKTVRREYLMHSIHVSELLSKYGKHI